MKIFLLAKLAEVKAYFKSPQFKQQAVRGARLFAFTLFAAAVGLFKAHDLSLSSIGAAVVAALEVVTRAFFPTVAPVVIPAPVVPVPVPTEPLDTSSDETNPEA